MDVITIISTVVGLLSLAVAIITYLDSRKSQEHVRRSFSAANRTRYINYQYDAERLLAEINSLKSKRIKIQLDSSSYTSLPRYIAPGFEATGRVYNDNEIPTFFAASLFVTAKKMSMWSDHTQRLPSFIKTDGILGLVENSQIIGAIQLESCIINLSDYEASKKTKFLGRSISSRLKHDVEQQLDSIKSDITTKELEYQRLEAIHSGIM